MSEKKNNNTMAVVAIMLVYLISGLGAAENPAIAACQAAWPNESVASILQLTTLYSLICVPVMLLIAPFVGKKIPYKAAMVAGALCLAVGGLGPIFIHPTWTVVLAFRALMGVGIGLVGPRNALLAATVSSEKYGKLVGLGNSMMFVFGIVAGPVVGMLVGISWTAAFWINIFAVPAAVLLILFLKEPEKASEADAAAEGPKEKTRMTGWVWVFAVMQAVMTGTVYPLLMSLSSQFEVYNIGSAALAGTVLSLYSVGATCGGLVIGAFNKIFKKSSLIAAMAGVAAFVGLIGFIPANLIVNIVCVFLSGVCFSICLTSLQVKLADICKPESLGFASTLLVATNMLGVYISTYFILGAHAVLNRHTIYDSANVGCLIVWAVMIAIIILGGKSLQEAERKAKS